MASYRYERDIDPKDLQPRKQRQYTRKERWANWWDYNLKWVIIIGIIVPFAAETLRPFTGRVAPVAASEVLCLFGGLILRFCLVLAGSHWLG